MRTMRKCIRKERGNEWCSIEVELTTMDDGNKTLSICGSEGSIVTQKQAKQNAVEYWESYFEDNPDALKEMNQRCNKRFRSPKSAAQFVLNSDGEYHGMDVADIDEDTDKVYIIHSCGQIRDQLNDWFPEVKEYFKYHLNDMHSECEHQEAAGMTYQTNRSAVCETCGWKIGHGWSRRELPAEVIAWAEHPVTKITDYAKAYSK